MRVPLDVPLAGLLAGMQAGLTYVHLNTLSRHFDSEKNKVRYVVEVV